MKFSGQTDQTDRVTDQQSDSYIAPITNGNGGIQKLQTWKPGCKKDVIISINNNKSNNGTSDAFDQQKQFKPFFVI